MVQNITDNLEENLDKFIGKNVVIHQDGFLKSRYFIKKLRYFIEYEVLNITDEDNTNFIKINLNQVYKLEHDENKLIFYLDNDTSISMELKR